jgi:hypothetical protein
MTTEKGEPTMGTEWGAMREGEAADMLKGWRGVA